MPYLLREIQVMSRTVTEYKLQDLDLSKRQIRTEAGAEFPRSPSLKAAFAIEAGGSRKSISHVAHGVF